MQQLLGWAPGTKVIFQEADGLPRVNCDLDVATQFCNAPGLQQDEEDEGDEGSDEEVAFGTESTVGPRAKREVREREKTTPDVVLHHHTSGTETIPHAMTLTRH